jgi:regulator of sigma E protease
VSEPNDAWLKLPEAERAVTFQSKALWKRAAVVLAGPLTNFLFAILIFAGFALAFGKVSSPAVINSVVVGSPADKAHLQIGDRITAIGGSTVDDFESLSAIVQDNPGSAFEIDYVRAGKLAAVSLVFETKIERDRFGNEYRIGQLGVGSGKIERIPVGIFEAPVLAVWQTEQTVLRMVGGLWQIISGRRSVQELGGPIKIAQISGQVATMGWLNFLQFLALISINLGFINLLPVPMLDGGHLSFYAIEAIRRKPADPKVMEYAFRSGMALVFGLMIFVTLNDLSRLGLWSRISGIFG